MSPQAGWYADPTDPASVRWWDGAEWSTETRPVPRELAMAGASAQVATAASVRAAAPAPTAAPAQAPTPSLAPVATAPTPVLAPHEHPTPTATRNEPTPTIADRSRPGPRTMAATPPAPLVAPTDPGPSVYPEASTPHVTLAPSSSPGAPAPGASTPARPATTGWVDSGAPAAPSTNQFGTAVGGTVRSGAAVSGFGAPVTATHPSGSEHHWGRTIAITLLVLALIGGAAAVGIPRYLTTRDQGIAASQPDVLARSAPATLAGARRAARVDPRAKAEASALTGQGARWAWSGSYGTRDAPALYVASDVPLDSRADAVRALGSRAAAQQLMSTLATATVAAGGAIVMGTPTEYASPVGGKTWCMPVTAAGVSGGFCTWTNGKEWLQVLVAPGIEQSAGRSILAALAQLAKITTKHSA